MFDNILKLELKKRDILKRKTSPVSESLIILNIFIIPLLFGIIFKI